MRRYSVAVKVNALYGREGAGISGRYDIDAGSHSVAAARGIRQFVKENRIRLSKRTMTVEVVRVL